jgi:hypothetical protein
MKKFRLKVRSTPWLHIRNYNSSADPFENHFGLTPSILTESSRDAIDRRVLKVSTARRGKLGYTVDALPEGTDSDLAKPMRNWVVGLA